MLDIAGWFLSARERGNPATVLDRRHDEGLAWTTGNRVTALVHGSTYFARLLEVVSATGRGDLVLFTDWRGDPDERLDGSGTEVGPTLAAAAERGAVVRGLVWRSHLDRFQFSAAENRHLGDEIDAAGGQCLLDMRVRPMGSHHQKLVVVRYADHPEDDVAFVGGIDLSHSRRDDAEHAGDPQAQPMAPTYGSRPPWHDAQLEIRGPAVGDVEAVFRERWDDPAPLSRNPLHRVADGLRGEPRRAAPLPPPTPDPAPIGPHAVQLLRTYPARRPGYDFAPRGERSVARAYAKVLGRARELVYVEDQYLWSAGVARVFADALRREPRLLVVAVIPLLPDQGGRAMPPNYVGREPVLDLLRDAGGDRFAVYGPENHAGTPVYVHAKVCVVDDVWASVGSDNVNLRSWTHDSELSAAVLGPDLDDADLSFAAALRLRLLAEHLDVDLAKARVMGLLDPATTAAVVRESAERLDAWHRTGRRGARPPGRLRPYRQHRLDRWTRVWAGAMYRLMYDPDGRSLRERRAGVF